MEIVGWLPLVRGGGCVGIPLSEEVDCVVLAKCLALLCEVVFVWLCALPLSVEVALVERGVVYSRIVFAPNHQWRFPAWEVLCGLDSENPSV